MKELKFFLLSFVLLVSTSVIAKVKYIQAPPLKSVINKSVKSCGQLSTVQVPLITWGGDIATVLANGGETKTSSNSIFGKKNLNLKLVREDVFSRQVENFVTCKSPFIRGTMGMVNLASEVTEKDPRTKMKIIYQLTWSAGGDAMVVKSTVNGPKDLKGKTIALQAYGPHVDYLAKILSDAGLTFKDVNIKWVKDLTGTANTPVEAFRETGIDAAMVIIPDALALTSNGTVGTGSEDSVKGARVLLSTKTANRVISDVYAVRSDFYEANKDLVFNFVSGLYKAQEELSSTMKNEKSKQYATLMGSAAKILLDSPQAIADTKGMYLDAEFSGYVGNQKFFTDLAWPRNYKSLTAEIQKSYIDLGLISSPTTIAWANFNFNELKSGLRNTVAKDTPKFDVSKVQNVVTQKSALGTLDSDALFALKAFFQANAVNFDASNYTKEFDKAVKLMSTYGGALLTVEGHSDPSNFERKKEKGATQLVLSRIRQAAKNLSLSRANAFRSSLIGYAKAKGISIDPSQIVAIGHGVNNPVYARPKTKQQWAANRRIEFRIVNVEAESDVFVPFE